MKSMEWIKRLLKKPDGYKDKPWLKSTNEGALYIDTSNPEWQKWFAAEITRLNASPYIQEIKKQIEINGYCTVDEATGAILSKLPSPPTNKDKE